MKTKKFFIKNKLLISIIFLLISFSLFLFLGFNIDSDYFWHIKVGDIIFNRGFFYNDIFSWFMKGKYWMSHEWGFEVIIYVLKILFGKYHLLIYVVFCLYSLFIIIFIFNRERYFKNILFMLFWLALSLILVVHISCRPHLLSFVFLALTIHLCYDLYLNKDSKKIYLLPIITILWSNIHGGSSNLSYLFPLIFIFCLSFNFNFNKIESKRITFIQIKRYLLVSLLCIFSIIINPHGIKMLIYPYSNLFDNLMISSISEWQPTVLSNIGHYPYFILCFIIFIILIFSKKKILFLHLVLFLISIYLGLKSIRFWGYTYIIMSFVITYYIPDRKIDRGTITSIYILNFILLGIFIFSYKDINYNNKLLDKELINILKKEDIKRLYNNYDYGGELIYNNINVFIDGRADLYSKYNLKDYIDISLLRNDYIKIINKYDFDYYLIDKNFVLNSYLKDMNYQILYNKNNIILYKVK